MKLLVLRAWISLARYDLATKLWGYRAVQEATRQDLVIPSAKRTSVSWERICEAVEIASVLYFKQVHCLQRSSVTALLLRRSGWDARLVIGVQMIPSTFHAWVELDGEVVNDKPYMRQKYLVLGQAAGSQS